MQELGSVLRLALVTALVTALSSDGSAQDSDVARTVHDRERDAHSSSKGSGSIPILDTRRL